MLNRPHACPVAVTKLVGLPFLGSRIRIYARGNNTAWSPPGPQHSPAPALDRKSGGRPRQVGWSTRVSQGKLFSDRCDVSGANCGFPYPLDLATVDYAALHHERDVLEHADVVEWIAGHGDDVGIVAGLERAELVLPVEQPGAVEQIGL